MLRELIADLIFGMQLHLTFILFLLEILWNLRSPGKYLSNRLRKYLPIFVATFLLKGGLTYVMFLFRCSLFACPWIIIVIIIITTLIITIRLNLIIIIIIFVIIIIIIVIIFTIMIIIVIAFMFITVVITNFMIVSGSF